MLTVQLDAPHELAIRDTPKPTPGVGEVMIQFEASCINPADAKIHSGLIVPRSGSYPFVLGWDLVGKVAALGPSAKGPEEGTRVIGMSAMAATARGTWSEYVVLPITSITPAPENIAAAVLAQLPLVGITALNAINDLNVSPEDRVLVVGAAGAVGAMTVQLLQAQGVEVHALVRTALQAEQLRTKGVTEVHIGRVPSRFFEGVIDTAGIDVAHALLPGGVYISVVPGTEPQGDVMKDKTGTVVVIQESGEQLAHLLDYVQSGTLNLPSPSVFGLEDISRAFESYEKRGGDRTVLVY